MPSPKTRYKANIDGQTYTIIGHESKEHMDLVVRLVNEQLNEIKVYLRKLIMNKLLS